MRGDLPDWAVALGYALTGRELPLAAPAGDVHALLAELAAAGWDEARLRELRASSAGWPFPVPSSVRGSLGAAQLHACVRGVVDVLVPAAANVADARPLDADERRLLAEVPPHHGS